MKSLQCCQPRQSVLDGSEDFVVNLTALTELSEAEATEFLDANVLTSGMEELITQSFDRLAGGPSRGIFKLSEAMGGGKTQSMIVCGLLARFPKLAAGLPFKTAPKSVKPDHVIAFTGRSTDENVWVTLGEQLGTTFPEDSAPSEKQWAEVLKGKSVLILLDELAFYLVHASTKGSREEGTRFSQRTAIALTNLFGAIRDHKEAARVAIVVADLQKDWDQGHEELAKIMRSDATLGGTLQSADNEMSKGAISISPVDNSKDELYSTTIRTTPAASPSSSRARRTPRKANSSSKTPCAPWPSSTSSPQPAAPTRSSRCARCAPASSNSCFLRQAAPRGTRFSIPPVAAASWFGPSRAPWSG